MYISCIDRILQIFYRITWIVLIRKHSQIAYWIFTALIEFYRFSIEFCFDKRIVVT